MRRLGKVSWQRIPFGRNHAVNLPAPRGAGARCYSGYAHRKNVNFFSFVPARRVNTVFHTRCHKEENK